MPSELKDYIIYTRNLGFEDEPDYSYLKGLFVRVLEKENCYYDFWFDWMKEKPEVPNNLYNKFMDLYEDHINKVNGFDTNKKNDNFIEKYLQTEYSDYGVCEQEIDTQNFNDYIAEGIDENDEDDNKNDNNKENKDYDENNSINKDEDCIIF